MKTKALFIFEGEAAENSIVEKLQCHILDGDSIIVTCVFCAEIYQLYEKVKDDTDCDMLGLIRERGQVKNVEKLSGCKRKDFSEVCLFFDYDAHSTLADDEKICKMLSIFNDQFGVGKLYVSYPMVEALRHIADYKTFNLLTAKCKGKNCPYKYECDDWDSCKEEPHYKTVVGRDGIYELQNLNSREKWIKVIKAHLSKMNSLVNGIYEFPNKLEDQQTIFEKQLDKYISKRCPEVAVLSAFPVFIHDYYGNERTKNFCDKTI